MVRPRAAVEAKLIRWAGPADSRSTPIWTQPASATPPPHRHRTHGRDDTRTKPYRYRPGRGADALAPGTRDRMSSPIAAPPAHLLRRPLVRKKGAQSRHPQGPKTDRPAPPAPRRRLSKPLFRSGKGRVQSQPVQPPPTVPLKYGLARFVTMRALRARSPRAPQAPPRWSQQHLLLAETRPPHRDALMPPLVLRRAY